MLNSLQASLIITRREVRDQFRDWRIITPIVILALFFPPLLNYGSHFLINFAEQNGATLNQERLMPFLMLVVGFFPISVSMVIALESFVGEKERHSIEPLLASPLSDGQVYLGKLLAAMIPPLLAGYTGMGFYLFSLYRQSGWLPDGMLLTQIFTLTTINCLVMVSGAVVISSQTTSMRAANLLAAFIILPVGILLQGQSIVLVWARHSILWWTVVGLAIIAVLLMRTGIAHFNREDLLGRELDRLDLRLRWQTFWGVFLGRAHSPLDWYRVEIRATIRRLMLPMLLVALVLLAGMAVGANLSRTYVIPAELLARSSLDTGMIQGLESMPFFEAGSIPVIWWHNLRVILLATLMGLFSFGVLAMVVLITPILMIGYFTGAVAAAGISPWLFLVAFVLPHGVLEVPAMILAGAAILRLGASIATPKRGHATREAITSELAEWARVMVALVIPLLLGAAILEILVTPKLALLIFGG